MKPTFGRILQERLNVAPDRLAYTFTNENEEVTQTSYARLLQRAMQIGAAICEYTRPRDRVMLMISPGLDYIASFLACWIHARVSVPAYPLRKNQHAARTVNIIADARPSLILAAGPEDALADLAQQHPYMPRRLLLSALAPVTAEAGQLDACVAARTAGAGIDDLVFLQYTSGSTGNPKGTMVSHGNLLHNTQQMNRKFQTSAQSTMVSWLPPFHDMGLILGVLQPLFGGFPCHLMAPAAFMQRPMRWLQLIASTQATISGGPNFAFDLCVRRAAQLGNDLLDLRSWRVAFNGAEPIHAETLRSFATAFEAHGFNARSLHPCYGLAESTLMVSGQDPLPQGASSPECFVRILGGEAAGREPIEAVHSGSGIGGQVIRIVDPETREPCPETAVGEVWVSGPSVAQGYWSNEAATASTFRATLAGTDGAQTFLRTGDLGQIIDGQLYIRGRIKDLILVRGMKYYPQDLERCIEEAVDEIRAGGYCAVLQSDEFHREAVDVVAELAREHRKRGHEGLASAVRAVVASQFGLRVSRVRLLPPGRFPKTSSGKIPRRLIQREFLQDEPSAQSRQIETENA